MVQTLAVIDQATLEKQLQQNLNNYMKERWTGSNSEMTTLKTATAANESISASLTDEPLTRRNGT